MPPDGRFLTFEVIGISLDADRNTLNRRILTPPSLPRREKWFQFSGEATGEFCPLVFGFYKMDQRLFFLLAGEGQDEGERVGNPAGDLLSEYKFENTP